MERDYTKAKEICKGALLDWRDNINDFLPDWDDSYYIEWTIDDALYIQQETGKAIDAIMSTCMKDHIAYELHCLEKDFAEAIKSKDIGKCKRAMLDAQQIFGATLKALKAI